jgi:hypothetical protein
MSDLPGDLVPLPTAPYAERPVSLPLDIEECRTALWISRGNISEAAKLLKTTSFRLREFVKKSSYLSAEVQEAKDRLVDIAEEVVFEALTDEEDKGRKDSMARFVLASQGKTRNWGNAGAGAVNIKNAAGGTIQISWADGSTFGDSSANHPGAPDESSEESGERRESPPRRSPDVVDIEAA